MRFGCRVDMNQAVQMLYHERFIGDSASCIPRTVQNCALHANPAQSRSILLSFVLRLITKIALNPADRYPLTGSLGDVFKYVYELGRHFKPS